MGRLIDSDHVYNAIQITSDKFGIAKQPVESAMLSMLSQIPTANAVRIPENATNGDIVKTMFPTCRPLEGTLLIDTDIAVFEPDWWNAPYKGSEGVNED